MKVVSPYVDGNYQVIFIEFESESLQDFINGVILGTFMTITGVSVYSLIKVWLSLAL
jgi:hypothetical protein